MNKRLENIFSILGTFGIIVLMVIVSLLAIAVGRYFLLWIGFWNVPSNILGIFVSFTVGMPIVTIPFITVCGILIYIIDRIKKDK